MLRSVNILNLPEMVTTRLKEMGYEHVEDLEKALMNKDSVPVGLKFLIDEFNLLEIIQTEKRQNVVSAVDLWNFECYNPPVSIFHKGLDKLLRGGFPVGQVTEICGPPGSGKTQICLQAAIDVQIPSALGGSSGESLFISTDFGFKLDRLRQMSRETVSHISNISYEGEKKNEVQNFSVEKILSGVNVIKIVGYKQLFNAVMNLGKFLVTNNNVKLIIVDSFCLPFICDINDSLVRTRVVHIVMDKLQELSVIYKCAVLLTNQLTSVIAANLEKKLVPSLGGSFAHRIHKRIVLDEGKACLLKSLDQPQLFAEFQITESGIR